MTTTITEGKKDFTKIVREVESKEKDIIITRHNKPAVVILSYSKYMLLQRKLAIKQAEESAKELRKEKIRIMEIYRDSKKELEERY